MCWDDLEGHRRLGIASRETWRKEFRTVVDRSSSSPPWDPHHLAPDGAVSRPEAGSRITTPAGPASCTECAASDDGPEISNSLRPARVTSLRGRGQSPHPRRAKSAWVCEMNVGRPQSRTAPLQQLAFRHIENSRLQNPTVRNAGNAAKVNAPTLTNSRAPLEGWTPSVIHNLCKRCGNRLPALQTAVQEPYKTGW